MLSVLLYPGTPALLNATMVRRIHAMRFVLYVASLMKGSVACGSKCRARFLRTVFTGKLVGAFERHQRHQAVRMIRIAGVCAGEIASTFYIRRFGVSCPLNRSRYCCYCTVVQDEGISAVRLLACGRFGAIILRFESLYAVVLKPAFWSRTETQLQITDSVICWTGGPVYIQLLSCSLDDK